MDLYNLGQVNWIESQSIYHALAELGREGLIICYPDSPYVCLGLHDDLEHEVDREYCRQRGIPLLRRKTGGGVVYLDQRQIFYQLVIRKDNPLLPLARTRLYPRFLQPAISVYRSMGMPVELKEPADLCAGGRKCSGNACGDIGECVSYVGNLLLDFDYVTMSKVLRTPNETFRRYLLRAMEENMTTMKDWCISQADYYYLVSGLITEFCRIWGRMTPRPLDMRLKKAARQIGERLTSEQWLRIPGRRPKQRRVKIAEGVYLYEMPSGSQHNSMMLIKDGIEEIIEADVLLRR